VSPRQFVCDVNALLEAAGMSPINVDKNPVQSGQPAGGLYGGSPASLAALEPAIRCPNCSELVHGFLDAKQASAGLPTLPDRVDMPAMFVYTLDPCGCAVSFAWASEMQAELGHRQSGKTPLKVVVPAARKNKILAPLRKALGEFGSLREKYAKAGLTGQAEVAHKWEVFVAGQIQIICPKAKEDVVTIITTKPAVPDEFFGYADKYPKPQFYKKTIEAASHDKSDALLMALHSAKMMSDATLLKKLHTPEWVAYDRDPSWPKLHDAKHVVYSPVAIRSALDAFRDNPQLFRTLVCSALVLLPDTDECLERMNRIAHDLVRAVDDVGHRLDADTGIFMHTFVKYIPPYEMSGPAPAASQTPEPRKSALRKRNLRIEDD
jgi:hypothetical protein